MTTILIVGGGQIGSRHLQGAIQSPLALSITVVDPSKQSLSVSQRRTAEISLGNCNTRVTYLRSMPRKLHFNICIIATTASVRFEAFKSVIETCTVDSLVFEKILFQKTADYHKAKILLKDNAISAWVNCPRRMFECYRHIKTLLHCEQNIKLSVKGRNWGMACNSIHFIDLFSFFVSNTRFTLDVSLLEKQVKQSKRKGCYEIFGSLKGEFENHHLFELSCYESAIDTSLQINLTITTANFEIIINEMSGELSISTRGKIQIKDFTVVHQSQLTGLLIEDIMDNHCALTSFDESAELHQPFLESVKSHIENSLNEQLLVCPIT